MLKVWGSYDMRHSSDALSGRWGCPIQSRRDPEQEAAPNHAVLISVAVCPAAYATVTCGSR